MVHPILAHIGTKGARGALAGGCAGFVLGTAAAALSIFMGGEDTPPLSYNYKGTELVFENLEVVQDAQMEEDMATIDQYKTYNISAHGTACKAVQRFIDFYIQYQRDSHKRKNCTVHITRMQKAAKRADGSFRKLLYSLKEIHFDVAATDVEQAAMELHVSFEKIIALAREESLLRDNDLTSQQSQR